MKIAVLADIHGNLRALRTVLEDIHSWQPDLVYVLGDTINRGPRSPECLQQIRQMEMNSGWKVIKGNHEVYVLNFDLPDAPRSGPEFEILEIVHWTYSTLNEDQIAYNHQLPEKINDRIPELISVRAVHASMQGLRAGIYPSTPDDKLREMIKPAPDLFLTGHTHQPLIRKLPESTVVNAGSVGMPFDGDQRAGYARIQVSRQNIQAEIIRLSYNVKAAEADFYSSGFMDQGGPMAEIVLTELKLARPQLSHWNRTFRSAVIEEEITLEESVRRYLKKPNLDLAW